jgi:hypothetical protein
LSNTPSGFAGQISGTSPRGNNMSAWASGTR